MKYFKYSTDKNSLTLYPIVCWHIGARQSDEQFITDTIDRIKNDPNAVWLYLGDGGECVTKYSKGDVFAQTMPPRDQLQKLVDLLLPIREKGLFLVKGNHDARTFKESGLDFTHALSLGLQLPYLGTSAFWNLKVNRTSYDIFTHHGLDSGVNIGGKVNAAKKFEQFVHADAIFSAHSHICCELPPAHVAYLANGTGAGVRSGRRSGNVAGLLDGQHQSPIKWRTTREYICGCAYDSRTGYAEDKGYPPIIPAHLSVTFSGKIVNGTPVKGQTATIWRKEL